MDLIEETSAGTTILAIAGRIDTANADRLNVRLAALLSAARPHLLIELSRLTYIGSAGLRALLLAAKKAAGNDGRLALCSATMPVREIIESAGLSAVFHTYASREEALQSLRETG